MLQVPPNASRREAAFPIPRTAQPIAFLQVLSKKAREIQQDAIISLSVFF
jgi:hypothetical protein